MMNCALNEVKTFSLTGNECKHQINGNDIEFMMFQDKYYHNGCFACNQCRKSLAGGQKFKMMLGSRYCGTCR